MCLPHSAEHQTIVAAMIRIDWDMNPLFSDAQSNVEKPPLLAVAALMPLSLCRLKPLITGVSVAC